MFIGLLGGRFRRLVILGVQTHFLARVPLNEDNLGHLSTVGIPGKAFRKFLLAILRQTLI